MVDRHPRQAATGRVFAGAKLASMGLFWLVAWLPLAFYCVGSILVGALRPSSRPL